MEEFNLYDTASNTENIDRIAAENENYRIMKWYEGQRRSKVSLNSAFSNRISVSAE